MRYRQIVHIAYILLCMFVLCACSTSGESENLYRAEALATVAPDSAYTLLKKIDAQKLTSNEKALYQIVNAETFYLKHKVLNDSIDHSLSYIDNSYGKALFLRRKILHAVFLYASGDVENSMSSFEIVKRESEGTEIHPYWKCLIDDYLGIIYLHYQAFDRAKEHFYSVLEHAKALDNNRATANAYSHLSCYYLTAGQLDSAMYYATKVLDDKSALDSLMLTVAYQNIFLIQTNSITDYQSTNPEISNLFNFYRINSPDSLITYALMSQYYYLQGRLDSARICQHEVEVGTQNNAKLILNKFLAEYYRQCENTDSAYKYLSIYNGMCSTLLNNRQVEPALNKVHHIEIEDVDKRSQKQNGLIVSIAIFTILLVVVVLRQLHKRRITSAYDTINNQSAQINVLDEQREKLRLDLSSVKEETAKLKEKMCYQELTIAETEQDKKHCLEELDETRKTLSNTLEELQQTSSTLSSAKRKIESYQMALSRKNSKLSKANRKIEISESTRKNQSLLIVNSFLNRSATTTGKMKKAEMEYIINTYASSEADRKEFIDNLYRKSSNPTPTNILICILYHENFSDEEIVKKLNYDRDNFRMAKSRARLSISSPNYSNCTFIIELLKKFDYKKTTV